MNVDQICTLYQLKKELEKNNLFSLMMSMSIDNLDDLLRYAELIAAQAATLHTQVSPPACSQEADRK